MLGILRRPCVPSAHQRAGCPSEPSFRPWRMCPPLWLNSPHSTPRTEDCETTFIRPTMAACTNLQSSSLYRDPQHRQGPGTSTISGPLSLCGWQHQPCGILAGAWMLGSELGLGPSKWKGMIPTRRRSAHSRSSPVASAARVPAQSAEASRMLPSTREPRCPVPTWTSTQGGEAAVFSSLGWRKEQKWGWGSLQSPIIWNPLLSLQHALPE